MTLLTPRQMAELAQLSEATVLRLCREGKMPGARKLGGSWRISEARFQEWLEGDTIAAPATPAPGNGQSNKRGWR